MKRTLWRLQLAATMLLNGWGFGLVSYALRGGYDDPYYDDDCGPTSPRDVLREEISAGMS